jgi:hypothetical protein
MDPDGSRDLLFISLNLKLKTIFHRKKKLSLFCLSLMNNRERPEHDQTISLSIILCSV